MPALVVSYDYHPNAVTLFEAHIKHSQSPGAVSTPIPETIMWSYITQIGSAIRAVHAAGLAVRMIDISKVLLTGKNRFVLFLFLKPCLLINLVASGLVPVV